MPPVPPGGGSGGSSGGGRERRPAQGHSASATMLRQHQILRAGARLGLGSAPWAAGGGLPVSAALIGEQWRSQSSQAAPADSAEGPVLPPFDYQPPAWTGPSKEEVLRLRKEHLNPGEREHGIGTGLG